jgi:hypothetical protein
MAISSEQVQERLKTPKSKEQLNIAVLHEDRVKFCVKKCLEYNRPVYTNTHLFQIGQLLPIPKYQKYVAELSFPLPIMETADVIYSGLYKIFNAQNKAIYPILSNPDLTEEFNNYLDSINFNQFWETTAWQAFRNQPNCVMVIDMDVEQGGLRPTPEIYPVDVTAIKDIDLDDDGEIEFLLFVNCDGFLVAVDEEAFYTYPADPNSKGNWLVDDSNVVVGFHRLGYCPAVFLIQDALDNTKLLIKESPVTKVLYAMEKLLFRIISGENLEDYASYPIHVIAKTECTYEDESGNRCNSGFINYMPAGAITNAIAGGTPSFVMLQKTCPVCSNNHLVGSGSAYEAQPDDTGKFDLDNVVKIVSADVDTLVYVSNRIEDRKNNIVQSCIGTVDQHGQAMNEKQIVSMFEDRQTILMRTKRNFERAIKFCMDTIGRLQYETAYVGSTVNLGTRFLLATTEEIQARLDGAFKSNAPQYELGLIRDEMNTTEYANNPRMLQRLKILQRLEPYPNLSTLDCETLLIQNKILQNSFELKYNFVNFIAQFEDENGDIVDFGSLLPFSSKIDIIKTKILEYATKESAKLPSPADRGQGAGKALQPTFG